MTIINPNSISGITSITAQGSNIDFFKSDGALAGLELGGVNFYSTSGVSTFSSIHVGNDIRISSGIVTATTFSGALSGNVTGNVNSSGVSTFSGGIVVSTGATTGPSISPSNDNNTGIFFPSADTIAFAEGGVEAMRINSSSQIGIGTAIPGAILDVAPDANRNLQVQGKSGTTYGLEIKNGTANSGGEFHVTAASSGGVVFNRGTTEMGRFDSSSRLLVGTTSSVNSECIFQSAGDSTRDWAIKYTGTAGGAETGIRWLDKNNAVNAQISNNLVDDGVGTTAAHLVFKTSTGGTLLERCRITNAGYFKATNDGSYVNATGQNHEFSQTKTDEWGLQVYHKASATGNFGLYINYPNRAPNDDGNSFLYCNDSTNLRAAIRSNGGLHNYSANNSSLSDINAKKDISPANGTWDCIKQWEIVNYRYKDQPDDVDLNLGVIAQQVAESCPEVITIFEEAKEAKPAVLDEEGNEVEPAQGAQPERLGVKEQQMYWMAIKALQEAQIRIEALEAEVAALKAQ